jgi:glycosidase
MIAPFDWTDVAQLNYDNDELRTAMIDALKFWVAEADIDGYRCDVAGMVPTDFWERARKELDMIKPVFMLAEAEQPDHHIRAFDMSYAWEMHHLMNKVAKGEAGADTFDIYFRKHDTLYPSNAYRMHFTSNHDENSWNGTEFERMGEGARTFAVFSATVPGMPLIYSGQEAALNKRLEFFEKDEIDWNDYPLGDFYRKLLSLKHQEEALWNGEYGGAFKRIKTSDNRSIYAFTRTKGNSHVVVILNLTAAPRSFTLKGSGYEGTYRNWMDGSSEFTLWGRDVLELGAWGYLVLVD